MKAQVHAATAATRDSSLKPYKKISGFTAIQCSTADVKKILISHFRNIVVFI